MAGWLHKTFRASLALAVLAGTVFAHSDVEPDAKKQKAPLEKQIRLDPAEAFPELPRDVIAALKSQNCKVPQASETITSPNNVIRGDFAAKGQIDWAVLCSIQGVIKIELFWGGPARCPSEIGGDHDEKSAKESNGETEFLLAIQPIDREAMEAVNGSELNDRPIPLPISHDGIDEEVVGKASVVHYCNAGQWIHLTGSD